MKPKNDMEALEFEGEELSTNLGKYGERLRVFNINEVLIDDLIFIKPEHKKLYKGILTYIKTNVPKNILVKGVRGTGKTLLTRKFSEKIADRFKDEVNTGIHYVNCRDNFRELAVLQCIINKYQRGVSTAKVNSEFLELTKKYERNIIILDEVEHLENVDAIYTLTRTPNVIVIATSLTGAILDKVAQDPSVQSSFNPEIIFFGSYEIGDLFEIFNKRVKYVLNYNEENDNITENLTYLSALLRKEHGSDLRVGIESLYRIFQNESNFSFVNKHTTEKLQKLYEKYLSASKEKLDRDSLMNLDTTNLIILFSISLAKKKNKECSVIDAYKIYNILVKEQGIGKEMTDRAFRKYLPGLQSQEYFSLVKDRRGRSTINYFDIDDSVMELTFERFKKEYPFIELLPQYKNLIEREGSTSVLDYTNDSKKKKKKDEEELPDVLKNTSVHSDNTRCYICKSKFKEQTDKNFEDGIAYCDGCFEEENKFK